MQGYIKDTSPEAKLMIGGDMRKIQLCFYLLKVEREGESGSCLLRQVWIVCYFHFVICRLNY